MLSCVCISHSFQTCSHFRVQMWNTSSNVHFLLQALMTSKSSCCTRLIGHMTVLTNLTWDVNGHKSELGQEHWRQQEAEAFLLSRWRNGNADDATDSTHGTAPYIERGSERAFHPLWQERYYNEKVKTKLRVKQKSPEISHTCFVSHTSRCVSIYLQESNPWFGNNKNIGTQRSELYVDLQHKSLLKPWRFKTTLDIIIRHEISLLITLLPQTLSGLQSAVLVSTCWHTLCSICSAKTFFFPM